MLVAQDWARLRENHILCQRSFQVPAPPSDIAGHPACLSWLHDYLLADYKAPARVVECRDASILMWTYTYQDGFIDYLLFPFTEKMNGLARDEWRIKVAPFVHQYRERDGTADLDFTGVRRIDVEADQPCFFVGGRDNFLHWLIDHLALAVLPDAEPYLEDAVLVTGQLRPWQKETLDFFEVKNKVIELAAPDDGPTLFRLKHLIVPAGFPLAQRFQALRSRYARYHGQPKGAGPNVYLSRGSIRPRHRVANEDEVADFFVEKGFIVLYPEQMSLHDVASYCANAGIIATAPGSANGNFFVFSADDAVLIYLVPESGKREVSYAQATVGYANLLVFIDRLVTVFGRALSSSSAVRIEEDAEEHYDLADLSRAVDRAYELRDRRLHSGLVEVA